MSFLRLCAVLGKSFRSTNLKPTTHPGLIAERKDIEKVIHCRVVSKNAKQKGVLLNTDDVAELKTQLLPDTVASDRANDYGLACGSASEARETLCMYVGKYEISDIAGALNGWLVLGPLVLRSLIVRHEKVDSAEGLIRFDEQLWQAAHINLKACQLDALECEHLRNELGRLRKERGHHRNVDKVLHPWSVTAVAQAEWRKTSAWRATAKHHRYLAKRIKRGAAFALDAVFVRHYSSWLRSPETPLRQKKDWWNTTVSDKLAKYWSEACGKVADLVSCRKCSRNALGYTKRKRIVQDLIRNPVALALITQPDPWALLSVMQMWTVFPIAPNTVTQTRDRLIKLTQPLTVRVRAALIPTPAHRILAGINTAQDARAHATGCPECRSMVQQRALGNEI